MFLLFVLSEHFFKISGEVSDGLAVNNAENQGFSSRSECLLNCKTDNGCFVGKTGVVEVIFKLFFKKVMGKI